MPATPPPEHRRFVEDLLQLALKHGATELLMSVGAPPMMRLQARLVPLSKQSFTDAHVRSLADVVMQGQAWDEAQLRRGLHRTWRQPEGSRWRAEVQSHQGEPALWLCLLPETVPALDELHAPEGAATAALSAHGLLFMASRLPTLLCSAVAALAEHRHRHGQGRVALLDPDFPYESDAFVDMRAGLPDVGVSQALVSRLRGLAASGAGEVNALLLPPDTDDATLTAAIEAAPRMLCIVPLTLADRAGGWPAWLHERADAMPAPARAAWLAGVAATFVGSLRLCPVPRVDGRGDTKAWVCIAPQPTVSEAIARGEYDGLAEFERGPSPRSSKSMTALDDALFEMHERGEISWEDALRHADSVNALRLAIKLKSKTHVGDLSAGTDILFMDEPPMAPKAAVPEPVQLRAFVPQAIAQGGSGIVDLWACLPDQAAQVAGLAATSRQTLQAGLRAGLPVARGALLCITLQIDGLEVTEPTQLLPWIGEPGNVGFLVHASAAASVGPHVARAQLAVAGARALAATHRRRIGHARSFVPVLVGACRALALGVLRVAAQARLSRSAGHPAGALGRPARCPTATRAGVAALRQRLPGLAAGRARAAGRRASHLLKSPSMATRCPMEPTERGDPR